MSQAFLDQVTYFAKGRIAAEAAAWSIGAAPEPALYHEAAALGLLGIEVPEEMGGRGFSFGGVGRSRFRFRDVSGQYAQHCPQAL